MHMKEIIVSAIKFTLKIFLAVWIIFFIVSRITSVRLDAFFLPVFFLVFGRLIFKRRLPFLYSLMKRIAARTIKTLAGWLWQREEKKGGAHIRQPRMRWKP